MKTKIVKLKRKVKGVSFNKDLYFNAYEETVSFDSYSKRHLSYLTKDLKVEQVIAIADHETVRINLEKKGLSVIYQDTFLLFRGEYRLVKKIRGGKSFAYLLRFQNAKGDSVVLASVIYGEIL